MTCAIEYLIEQDGLQKVDILADDWHVIDSNTLEGRVDIKIGDKVIDVPETYLLNFSANLVFALRDISFYKINTAIAYFEEMSCELFLSHTDRSLVVQLRAGHEKENLSDVITVDLLSFMEACGEAHKELLKYFFHKAPKIIENSKFMNGYPDARMIARLLNIEGVK